MSHRLLPWSLLLVVGCSFRSESEERPSPADGPATSYVADPARHVVPAAPEPSGTATPPPPAPNRESPPPPGAVEGAFQEVVYVFMRDRRRSFWFCTGTLVAPTRVVTAAHCIEPTKFISYQVVAPLAAGKPRVMAMNPALMSTAYEDVANPDIGILTLESPIKIPKYADLTDVVARVDAHESLVAGAIVRTDEVPEAPMQESAHQALSSTVEFGYEHGFGTPMFTKGGDSGAGLFLVENGKLTHKLIGVARQPEPARGIDHFSRIDATFSQWYAAQK